MANKIEEHVIEITITRITAVACVLVQPNNSVDFVTICTEKQQMLNTNAIAYELLQIKKNVVFILSLRNH